MEASLPRLLQATIGISIGLNPLMFGSLWPAGSWRWHYVTFCAVVEVIGRFRQDRELLAAARYTLTKHN